MALYSGKLVVPREQLPKFFVGAALDRGGSMTKIAFLRKGEQTDESDKATIEFYSFKNDDFHEALTFLKENAHLTIDENLYLPATGIGTTRYQNDVKEALGLRGMTQFDEFAAQISGIAFLANNFDHSVFTHEFDKPYIASRKLGELTIGEQASLETQINTLRKMTLCGTAMAVKQMTQAMAAQSAAVSKCSNFPALISVGGSAFPIAIMDEETLKPMFLGGVSVGGKTFLALSHLMLGTTDYGEVCDLASAATLPTPEKKDLPSDKYEQLNQTLIDGFELNPSRINGSREVLARALVEFFAKQLADAVAVCLAQTGLTSTYFTGGFYMSSLIRNEIAWRIENALPSLPVQLHFLNNSSVGALGSLVCSDDLQKNTDETNARLQALRGGAQPAGI